MIESSQKEQATARDKLRRAVQSGKLRRPTRCSDCGSDGKKILGHHTDYSEPLSVVWLCMKCHIREHKKVFVPELLSSPHPSFGLLVERDIIDKHKYFDDSVDWDKYFANLTRRQRVVIRLKYGFENGISYTAREIAIMLKVSKRAINIALHNAVDRLKTTVAV